MWTPPDDIVARLNAKPSAPSLLDWYGDKPPPNEAVFQRYQKLANVRGRPYFLPFVDAFLEDEDGRPVPGHPSGCLGPRVPYQEYTKRRVCRKTNFCGFCWEAQCRRAGLLAALTHAGQGVGVKFSVSLPAAREDSEACKQARTAVWEFAKKAGFTRRTIWIHAFGQNPAQGAKGHLDGILSGPADADCTIFTDNGEAFQDILAPYHTTPLGQVWSVHVESRIMDWNPIKARVKDLILAGFYAGRPTFPTRMVRAGLYFDTEWRVRLTNVNRKTKNPVQIGPLTINGAVQRDWDQHALFTALNTAQEWHEAAGRMSSSDREDLPFHIGDVILEETRWRGKYRLPFDRELRKQYGL